ARIVPIGRARRPHNGFCKIGCMGQTSNERLRDYLMKLPPQSQALLLREFERAIDRGEDTAVATLVLGHLRKVVRGTPESAALRSEDAVRLLFRPLEPFLVEGSLPLRPGQIRRAALMPVWQWLVRDGAPEQSREYQTELSRILENADDATLESAVRKMQFAAAAAILKIASPSGGDNHRALARVGPPEVVEDLLAIGSVLQAHETLDALGSRLPMYLRT